MTDRLALLGRLERVLTNADDDRASLAVRRVLREAEIIEMRDLLFGPFQNMIDTITVDGFEGVDPELFPEWAKRMLAFLKEKLSAARDAHERAIVAVFRKHLTEVDVDVILTYNRTSTAKKLREITKALFDDLQATSAQWRNATLEPHVDEVKRIMGIEEPAPRTDDEPAPVEEPAPVDDLPGGTDDEVDETPPPRDLPESAAASPA
jgi:hypothetical protein